MIDIKPGERVMLEVRRHWYVLAVEALFLILFFLVPVAALGAMLVTGVPVGASVITLWVFFSGGSLLIGWTLFFVIWTNYYLDVWIVTDRKIIDIEQRHLFSRNISEFTLDKIQDITVEVSGIVPTVLHFGDIHVQTAGESQTFVIRHVPHPDKVKNAIFKQHEEFLKTAASRTVQSQ